jgi:deoxyribose-phosphate aldolase
VTGAERARQAVGLLDLTSLNDNDDEARIEKLCRRAQTPIGPVAAVCVWPRFVTYARRMLEGTGVRVAAVANFPSGSPDIGAALAEARSIVAMGGDEVDVVFPYNSWLNGDAETGRRLVAGCREACGTKARLKVILETGCLWRAETIADVARAAITAGADFIKTSTGKSAISATPDAARIMLAAIRETRASCGLKVSGGIRDAGTASHYLDIAERMMGADWISPRTFRFGASGVLDNLLAVAAGGTETAERRGY